MAEAREGLLLRPMGVDDLPAVAALEGQAFSQPWSLRLWQQEVEGGRSFNLVLEEGGSLAGYAGFYLAAGEAEVTRVAVDPARQGRGLGRYLLAGLLELAWQQGAEAVFLEVAGRNQPARSLYCSLGFQAVGLRKGYYVQDGDDALLMSLSRP